MKRLIWLVGMLVFSHIYLADSSLAQTDRGYKTPPPEIAEIAEANPTPSVSISPDKSRMLVLHRPGMPGIDELAEPELRIAGMRIRPDTNGPSRASFFTAVVIRSTLDGTEQSITGFPDGARLTSVQWSPNGERIAVVVTFDDRIELWGADVSTKRAARITPRALNAVPGSPCSWMPTSDTLVCLLIPEGRGPAPDRPAIPSGPVIQQNIDKTAPARTYQDLLKDPYDETLFEYFMGSQPALVQWDGNIVELGEPGLYDRFSPSPDGNYFLVQQIHRPFSYLVPASRFPSTVEIWNTDGAFVDEIASLPLQEEVPIGFDSATPGKRSINWRADEGATVYWVEALDGGDPRQEVPYRDEVSMLSAPFGGDPVSLVKLEQRYGGIQWGNSNFALVWDRQWSNRSQRGYVVNPSQPESESRLLFDLSTEDRYGDPGRPMMVDSEYGTSVIQISEDGNYILLSGAGASDEGDRPFLDRMNIRTGQTERLWQSTAPYYESIVDWMDVEKNVLLTRRESVSEPPNYFARNLDDGSLRQITEFPHPYPQLKDVSKEMITYTRDDGVTLTAELFLPAGYNKEDGPLPTLVWAYPVEFKDADAAGQVSGSPYRFSWVSSGSPLFWVVRGYAVLNDASMPIIGEDDAEPNDTFVKQLVANADAVISEGARRGVVDPDRVAIGGHSYGAFMTANLLAHSDLFRAGIARSGAYNRTLTPFGFQREERTFWEAPEIYFAMSPFMHAQKVNEPLLLIHGAADNNSGTFPLQSERFYNALKGHGATARLVMLPHESHGYRARESVLHMLWEMDSWLDTYVKNASPRDSEIKVADPQG